MSSPSRSSLLPTPPIRRVRPSAARARAPIGRDSAVDHARGLLAECGLEAGTDLGASAGPPTSAALEWLRCGAMALTGSRTGAPRFAAGPLATAARGAGLALAAMAPDSPLVALDAPALLGERAAIAGLVRQGRVSAGGSARLLETCSGWIAVNLPREQDWSLAPAWLEVDAPHAQDWTRLAEVARGRSAETLVARGRLMGLAIAHAPQRIPDEIPWLRATHLSSSASDASERTAERIRLLDLSHLWAGPLATSLLALAGIEVLKIESPTRPDGARRGPKPFFDLLHGAKRFGALDLQNADDRAHFAALLEQADVVVESARPRALEQLGYDAARWVDGRAGRLWASITGYGRRGPRRDWIAFGDDAAAAAGLAWPAGRARDGGGDGDGGNDDRPCFCGDAIADPLTGLHAAVAILGHLRAGRGALLDLSLVGVSARAASLPASDLALPLERDAHGWCVRVAGVRQPVEAPRARRPAAAAPALTAATGRGGWPGDDAPC